nr:hypothetical protein [Tanacetum cinerariifolium]
MYHQLCIMYAINGKEKKFLQVAEGADTDTQQSDPNTLEDNHMDPPLMPEVLASLIATFPADLREEEGQPIV